MSGAATYFLCFFFSSIIARRGQGADLSIRKYCQNGRADSVSRVWYFSRTSEPAWEIYYEQKKKKYLIRPQRCSAKVSISECKLLNYRRLNDAAAVVS